MIKCCDNIEAISIISLYSESIMRFYEKNNSVIKNKPNNNKNILVVSFPIKIKQFLAWNRFQMVIVFQTDGKQ